MALTDIVSAIDAEIATLEQARALLAAGSAVTVAKRKAGRPPKVTAGTPIASPQKKKRVLSPEGRARIAEAAKKRWAAQKKAAAKYATLKTADIHEVARNALAGLNDSTKPSLRGWQIAQIRIFRTQKGKDLRDAAATERIHSAKNSRDSPQSPGQMWS